MSIFDNLSPQQPQQVNPMQMMQQLRSNPASFLKGMGLNIPAGMTDPQQMVNYLMQSGQVTPPRFRQAQQMMQRR